MALERALSRASTHVNHAQDINNLTQVEALARQLGAYFSIVATIVEYFAKLVGKSGTTGHDERMKKELGKIENKTIERLARES